MEEQTLRKKIEVDLKVLAKIEREKNPGMGNIYFKVVQIGENDDQDEQDDDESNDEQEAAPAARAPEQQQPTPSLAQKPVEQKSADEFV